MCVGEGREREREKHLQLSLFNHYWKFSANEKNTGNCILFVIAHFSEKLSQHCSLCIICTEIYRTLTRASEREKGKNNNTSEFIFIIISNCFTCFIWLRKKVVRDPITIFHSTKMPFVYDSLVFFSLTRVQLNYLFSWNKMRCSSILTQQKQMGK